MTGLPNRMSDTTPTPLNLTGPELMCLAIRETGTRHWSGQHTAEHHAECRFCQQILHSAADLRRNNQILNDNGQPIPNPDQRNTPAS